MHNLRLSMYRGKWHAIWTDGYTRRVSLGTADLELAKTRFAAFRHQAARAARPPDPTVQMIADAYMADKGPHPRLVTALRPLAPLLPLLPAHLTRDVIRKYTAQRSLTVQDGTIGLELRWLRTVLNWAVKTDWLEKAPHIETPSSPPPRDRWLTRAEASMLLEACQAPHLRLFVIIALNTAARSEAILELEWDRVDFARGRVDFNPRVRRIGAKGRAIVPMNNTLRAALSSAQAVAITPYVIEYANRRVGTIRGGFRTACEKAGLSDVTPHTLRHTAATWLAQAGVPMWQIAGYLGHASSRVTERVYAHHSPDWLRDAAETLE